MAAISDAEARLAELEERQKRQMELIQRLQDKIDHLYQQVYLLRGT